MEHTAQLSLDSLERNKMRVVPGVTSKGHVGGKRLRAAGDRHADRRAVYKKLGEVLGGSRCGGRASAGGLTQLCPAGVFAACRFFAVGDVTGSPRTRITADSVLVLEPPVVAVSSVEPDLAVGAG